MHVNNPRDDFERAVWAACWDLFITVDEAIAAVVAHRKSVDEIGG